MDHYLRPEFDFSELDEDELFRMGNVTFGELESVIRNGRTKLENAPGWALDEYFYCAIGFSSRARVFFILIKYENDKICFKDLTFANEYDIEQFWCRRGRKIL